MKELNTTYKSITGLSQDTDLGSNIFGGILPDGSYGWMFTSTEGHKTPLKLSPQAMEIVVEIYKGLNDKKIQNEIAMHKLINHWRDIISGNDESDVSKNTKTVAGSHSWLDGPTKVNIWVNLDPGSDLDY
jgi:hypothetical protein